MAAASSEILAGGPSIENLPEEVLEKVLNYLDVENKQCLVRVCRTWLRILYQPFMWRHAKPYLKGININKLVLDSLVKRGIRRVVIQGHRKFKRVLQGLASLGSLEITCYGDHQDNPDELIKVFSKPIEELTVLKLPTSFCELSDDVIKAIARNAPNLIFIQLESVSLGRAAVRAIVAGLRKLRYLQMNTAICIRDKAIEDLVASKLQLDYLAITNSNFITNDAVRDLCIGMPGLRSLDLTGCNLTDVCLVYLTRLPNLCQLRMGDHTKFTDAGRISLCRMKALRDLHLRNSNFGDAGVAELVAGGSKIFWLDLARSSSITDSGLLHLLQLSDLREVDLTECPNVTEAGLAILRQKTSLTVTLTTELLFGFAYDDVVLARLAACP